MLSSGTRCPVTCHWVKAIDLDLNGSGAASVCVTAEPDLRLGSGVAQAQLPLHGPEPGDCGQHRHDGHGKWRRVLRPDQ